eukprot:1238867-Pleurochrysis_carterae.AAC.1
MSTCTYVAQWANRWPSNGYQHAHHASVLTSLHERPLNYHCDSTTNTNALNASLPLMCTVGYSAAASTTAGTRASSSYDHWLMITRGTARGPLAASVSSRTAPSRTAVSRTAAIAVAVDIVCALAPVAV